MSAERVYRLLLRAYPPGFRGQYEREMVLLFRDQCRESDVRTVSFWARVLWDVARSAPALRVEAWRESTRTMGVTMKIAAVLSVLVGVFGVVNAAVEWVSWGTGTIQGTHGLALVLGVCASVLLLAAGVAILRPTERGRLAGRLALVTSVVLLVAARLLFPWMSYLSQLVGFGLPVALLVALYRPGRPSALGAASIVLVLVFGLSARASAQDRRDTTPAADIVEDGVVPGVRTQ